MISDRVPNIFHAAASATKDLSRVFTPWSHAVALIYQQLLEMYGTAGGWKSDVPRPKPLYLQGFLPFTMTPVG